MFARRLQIQERLTSQIAETIQQRISPEGVGVIIEARHLCMVMRGVEKQHSQAVTSAMLGVFRESKQTRDEFLALIRPSKSWQEGHSCLSWHRVAPGGRFVLQILSTWLSLSYH